MKKTFLFRLFAITFFCLASLVIKSESAMCNLDCRHAAQKAAIIRSLLMSNITESPLPNDDGFFIRI